MSKKLVVFAYGALLVVAALPEIIEIIDDVKDQIVENKKKRQNEKIRREFQEIIYNSYK